MDRNIDVVIATAIRVLMSLAAVFAGADAGGQGYEQVKTFAAGLNIGYS